MIEDVELEMMQMIGQVYDCSKFDSCGRHCPHWELNPKGLNKCKLKQQKG